MVLSGASAGVQETFLVVWLRHLGGSGLNLGLARFVTCFAEMGVFHFSGRMLKWLGIRRVMALAQMAYILRFTWYSMLSNPWWVLPCETLHGLTFGAMWSAVTTFASQSSPVGREATLQGVVSSLHWGVGFSLGSLGGGMLWKRIGMAAMFQVFAATSAVSCALICFAAYLRPGSEAGLSDVALEKGRGSDGEGNYELVQQKEAGSGRAEGMDMVDAGVGSEGAPSIIAVGEEVW
ncbi:unnamed protein product [Chrysoparadoxa australica]